MFDNIEAGQSEVQVAINAGNPTDFKTIYDACMQMLFKISYRIVNDEEAAEDLVHDSLIKANEKCLVFPSLNDCKYWLIRVVKNASLNYVKRKDRERKAYEKVLYEDHRNYEFWQVFSDEGNIVQVRVAESDLQYLDETKGVLAGATAGPVTGGYRYYTVKPSVVTNELIDLTAAAKDSTHIPTWTLPHDKTVYSGSTFWFHAGVMAADNVITLGVDRDASNHAYYSFFGSAYTSTLNLSDEHDASDAIPVQGVAVMMPLSGGVSMEDGDFDVSAVYLVGGSTMRYLVSYNGQTTIREVKLAPANAAKTTANYEGPDGATSTVQAVPVSLGSIKVDTWVPGGARFSNVTVSLGGFNSTAISAVELNGKKLEVSVTVQPGSD